jgi:hypothetical protein
MLERLGPEIKAQVDDKANLPALDQDGAWRLFGKNCRCQLAYKEVLLCKF